jgi:hypothetical protein
MQSNMAATTGNRIKLGQVETTLSELIEETLRRGFYGKAVLKMVIHDGTIQQLRKVVEKVER